MNTHSMKGWLVAAVPSVLLLLSCGNPMTLETRVHEDGSLDKTITFEKADSMVQTQNMFNIRKEQGWNVTVVQNLSDSGDKKQDYRISFEKHFDSPEAMNAELETEVDTLFSVKSSFEKKFRWFYTYIRYSETYRPINRFTMLPAEDYFNAEDMQFIRRLPSEGKPVSKADSVSLQMLNLKIDDHFARMAMYLEQYDMLKKLVVMNNLDKRWLDTLERKQDYIYDHILDMKGDPLFVIKMADSLKLPLPKEKAARDAAGLSANFNARIRFMSFARNGSYNAIIEMPWNIVHSNADSVAGNKLFWRPMPHKFMFSEYALYAESRKLNLAVTIASAMVVLLTMVVLLRKMMKT